MHVHWMCCVMLVPDQFFQVVVLLGLFEFDCVSKGKLAVSKIQRPEAYMKSIIIIKIPIHGSLWYFIDYII